MITEVGRWRRRRCLVYKLSNAVTARAGTQAASIARFLDKRLLRIDDAGEEGVRYAWKAEGRGPGSFKAMFEAIKGAWSKPTLLI